MKILVSKAFQISVIVILTVLAYSNIFQNDFATDDVGYFLNWQIPKDFRNIPKILTTDSVPRDEQGVYRPVKALFLMASYKIWGVNLFGYHLVSLAVHLASTVLVYFITREVFTHAGPVSRFLPASARNRTRNSRDNQSVGLRAVGNPSTPATPRLLSIVNGQLSIVPLVTALLFGLHPIHTEAVTFMLASYDSIGFVFFLASFYLFVKCQTRLGKDLQAGFVYWASVGLAILAFLTYELTLSLPLVIMLYDLCFKNFKFQISNFKFLRFWPYFSLLVFYGVWRVVLGIGIRGDYLGDSFFKTMLVMAKALVLYLWLSIWPVNLSLDHQVFPGVYSVIYKSFSDSALLSLSQYKIEILASIFVLALLLVLALKSLSKWPIVTFAVGWFFITLLPVSFILPQSSIMAERYSYLATFGWCLLLAYVLLRIFNLQFGRVFFRKAIFNQFLKFKYLIFISNYKLRSFPTEKQIKNFVRLFIVTIVTGLTIVYSIRTYVRNKDYHDTLTVWLVMGKQNPASLMTNYTIGKIYEEKSQDDLAIAYFQKALAIQPQTFDINFRLGRLYQKAGQLDLSVKNYQLALLAGNKGAVFAKWELERLARMAKFGRREEGVQKNTWRQYRLGTLSFSYPGWWLVTREENRVFFDSPDDYFSVEFSQSVLKEGQSPQDYLAGLSDIGNLLKLTETKIGKADFGVAKFFKDESVERLEIFLFKGTTVIKIWVYPVNLSAIKEFDRILGTIEIN